MPAKISFTQCPMEYGVSWNPSDTQHRTVRNDVELGKVYYDRRPDGSEILVKILKNADSAALVANDVVEPSTSTGRFNKDCVQATSAHGPAGPVAGVVEDGYKNGVPIGYWFRAVVDADSHPVNLTTHNGAEATLAIGSYLVTDGNVAGKARLQVTGTNTDAVIRPNIENVIGQSLVVTTNGAATQAGITVATKIKLLNY